MLLRVDVGTPSTTTASTETSTNKNTPAPLHICLGTATHHRNGILFNIGRKNADVTFPTEKCVSRAHCAIRLLSLHSAKPSSNNDAGDNSGDDITNQAAYPVTAEERVACEASADGMAVAVDDLGSKFGTFVLFPKPLEKDDNSNTETKKESDDEETDDEVVDLSGVASSASQSKGDVDIDHPQIIKRVETKSSLLLPSLSLPKTPSSFPSSPSLSNSVSIQCGPTNSSSAIIRITRIPLSICHSRVSTKDKKHLLSVLPLLGATLTSTFDNVTTTHLVTPDRISTAKTICAWACNVPIVSLDWIHALAERKRGEDPLPDENNYVPPGRLPMDDLNLGNNADSSLNISPRQCLKGYKCLSLIEGEAEMMCRCGGATIVPLYRSDANPNSKEKDDFWKQEYWWDELKKEQEKDGMFVVWLDSGSRKVKDQKTFLVNFMHKQRDLAKKNGGFQISCVSQKEIAAAMSSLGVLKDFEGIELVLASSSNRSQSVIDKTGNDNNTSNMTIVDIVHNAITDKHSTEEDTFQSVASQGTQEKTSNVSPDNDGIKAPETAQQERFSKTYNKMLSSKGTSSQYESVGWMTSSQRPSKDNEKNSIRSKRTRRDGSIEEDANAVDETAITDNRKSTKRARTMEESQGGDDKVETKSQSTNRKHKLRRTKDGWFIAAPQGKKRALYKCSVGELAERGEVVFSEAAETEKCGNLIVRSQEDLEAMQGNMQRSQNRHNNQASITNNHRIKNFKRFQKNSVIAGARMHLFSRIKMRSVLPKESERQRQLELSQQQLEREQRVADALFAGDQGPRRGGAGAGTIQNFFRAAAGSRSTGRRRR